MTPPVPKAGMMLVGILGIDHICPLLNALKELAHLICRCLTVIIQAYDDISLNLVKACHQRTVLSEVLGQIDSCYILIFPA